jgi:hypothetical protein
MPLPQPADIVMTTSQPPSQLGTSFGSAFVSAADAERISEAEASARAILMD